MSGRGNPLGETARAAISSRPMSYRDPLVEPLIIAGSAGVQAFDPNTGAVLWERALTGDSNHRVAQYGDLFAVANSRRLTFLDVRTGEVRAEHTLSFFVVSLLAHGPYLVAAGTRGMACFRQAQPTWGVEARETPGKGWLATNEVAHVVVDGRGGEAPLSMWAAQGSGGDVAIALGAALAQADRDT